MLTSLARRRSAANALKRTWANDPCPEQPVPESAGGLRAAANAARKAGDAKFDTRDLYDAVRAIGKRVLVCPSAHVGGDVAAMCVMARDVCCKPTVVLAPPHLAASVKAKLQTLEIELGVCEFGRKVQVMGDISGASSWDAVGLRGIILISWFPPCTAVDAFLATGVLRTVIAMTTDRYAHAGPASFSRPSLWTFSASNAAHRGSRDTVTAGLRDIWLAGGRNAWADDCASRTVGRECVICMDDCKDQCVASCCTSAFCASCAERWVQENETCPGCRTPADYTTIHFITEG